MVVVLLWMSLTLTALDQPAAAPPAHGEGDIDACLATILDYHGHVGPWAVLGYRMGEHARENLNLPRHSRGFLVVHHTPMEFKYTCVADGLMATTGASPGKMNLNLEPATLDDLHVVITDRYSGRVLTYRVRPEIVSQIRDIQPEQLHQSSHDLATLPDARLFEVVETRTAPSLVREGERILP